MPLKITSTDKDQMAQALGISDRRYEEIAMTIKDVMDKSEGIRYSQIAECVANRLELNSNEVFFLGVMIGGYIQFRAFVDGTIQVLPEEMNVPKEMEGRPIVKSHITAMA